MLYIMASNSIMPEGVLHEAGRFCSCLAFASLVEEGYGHQRKALLIRWA